MEERAVVKVERLEGEILQFTMARRLLGRPLYRTAAYLVDGLLVDTGMAHTKAAFLRKLNGLEVHTVVNTHSHEDHIAANAALQASRGAKLLAHRKALPVLADPSLLMLKRYQRFLFGTPEPSMAEALGEEVATERHRFRVLPAPGHSIDHVALFEAERGWLFAGDAYVGGRERVLRDDFDVWAMVETYRAFAALHPKLLLGGTGAVVRESSRHLREKIAHLEMAGERVWALHRKGWDEAAIARECFGNDWRIRWFTANHFAASHLVRSFLSHPPR
jgi:glyoxylase-like metal-dependent hydrolase (beta-lactamase superfamily II)